MTGYVGFVTSLIYDNLGAAELGPAPSGSKNQLTWSVDRLSATPTNPGDAFLSHHLDLMLSRYEAWRSLHLLPPVRPWDGSNVFPNPSVMPVGPAIPASLAGSPFPSGWTSNDLGLAVENYYDTLRNYQNSGRRTELDDEIKALFSMRYWSFMRWVSDLGKRLLGQPVFPVPVVYDRDGTLLSDKAFMDYFNDVHHVWHPNSDGGATPPATSWTQATPGFKTGVGQYKRKKQISRTQVGAEFFTFHRDHLLLFDRWLARTGQDPAPSINTCAHDTSAGALPSTPAGLDVGVVPVSQGFGLGYPVTNYQAKTAQFNPPRSNMWDGSRAGFDGTLREFSSLGEMGQFFATDFNPFPFITVPGTNSGDSAYHGPGHFLNGDLGTPTGNNYSPRFFAWHGFIDDLWTKRQPRFNKFMPVNADSSTFSDPQVITILRDLPANTDSIEPNNAVQGLSLSSGNGTLRCRINVRQDPFNRPLELQLRLEVLREAGGATPILAMTRNLLITPVGSMPVGPNEREQEDDFVEMFVFDGSGGTTDSDGHGPFRADNLAFSPTPVGFKNSLIRITGYLVCTQTPDGTSATVSGTLSSSGTSLTGSGTAFTTQLRQGDLIRAAGQVRMAAIINSNTSITLVDPFAANLPAGTSFERLDGFDHEEIAEISLVQEKDGPEITVYLDHSSFSKDEVDVIASGGQSIFTHAFYLVVQDRTSRPAPISWPPDLIPQVRGLIAPPLRAAGLYTDPGKSLKVELRDATTNALLSGQIDVTPSTGLPEDSSLHPSVSQRVTYPCQVTFTGNTAFSGMATGTFKDMKLVVIATDRSGNQTTDDSIRVRLQVSSNPYMIDGPTSWLSVDTRVLQIQQGAARFGVGAGWTNPNDFIAQVIDNLRMGNGTAGGDSFDGLPQDQAGSVLEYATQVGGVNIYNFAFSKVRMRSMTGTNTSATAPRVRASFRLFRWGVANVEFNSSLAYRSTPGGMALLGRTSTNELASIPFFAETRVAVTSSMATQPDPKNAEHFPATGATEAALYFAAYLDINKTTPQFPQTFVGDGGFGAVPAASMRSIRDLLIGQHQCMVVELFYAPDPTVISATPGTSDNLSQRNLLILQTANPGKIPITRAVQHSFNIDLTRRRGRRLPNEPMDDRQDHGFTSPARIGESNDLQTPRLARPHWAIASRRTHDGLKTAESSFLAQVPGTIEALQKIQHAQDSEATRWLIDPDLWKPTRGLDELVFFWNNLPKDSHVEIYLPGVNVEEIFNFRSLRHAPGTVRIVDSHTLHLSVAGPTYLPIAPFWGDNLAGLVSVGLPEGIRDGQKFRVDVVQMRENEGRILGGFQLNIQVSKAERFYAAETRMLSIFHQRLELTHEKNRWYPILQRQVEYLRNRARGLIQLANLEGIDWYDPTEKEKGQKVRMVLERIQILDDQDPFIKCEGEFRFKSRIYSRNNGGQSKEIRFPARGHYHISDKAGRNTIDLNLSLFEGYIQDHLAIEISGIEMDTFDPSDKLCSYRRTFSGPPSDWLGSFQPSHEELEPEDLKSWKLWYRIERA